IDGLPLCEACRAEEQDERSGLAGMTPPEQERHLRTLTSRVRHQERRRYDLPEPMTEAERRRVLRDIACYPDRWRSGLLSILPGPIAETAAAGAGEVTGERGT